MGTYLQGVESIIPSLQPYDNGLNVVSNLLQLKQSQYDTNYAQLGKMYGQYYYGDLTREDNIKKRDNTVKQIDFDLKRIAGLDLSQEKNVQQAGQIFKSFYEDGNLMKDMAWTKNFNKELGEAQGLLKSEDKEARDSYWEDGIKELQYRKEEFKSADANAAMGISSPVYTPYVNIQKKIMDLAKDADLSFEKTSMSQDGMWIIKNKNGEILKEPLSKLFEAQLGSDPSVQAVYKTQAYVNRKDSAYSNADKYGGVQQAEMKYLETAYTGMRDRVADRQKNVQTVSGTYDARIADIQKQIKQKGTNPLLEKTLKEYQDGKGVNDSILSKLDSQLDDLNGAYSSSGNTSTGEFNNPYKDIDQLRRIVDGNVAYDMMNGDIMNGAETFAYKDAKEDFKENPYAVLDMKHKQQLSEINAAGSWRYRTEQLRGANAINKRKADAYYDEFTYSGEKKPPTGGKKGKNEKTPGYVPQVFTSDPNKTPAENLAEATKVAKENKDNGYDANGNVFTVVESEGGNLNQQNVNEMLNIDLNNMFSSSIQPGVLQSLDMFERLKTAGVISADDMKNIFAPTSVGDPIFKSIKEKQIKINKEYADNPVKAWVESTGRKRDLSLRSTELSYVMPDANVNTKTGKAIFDEEQYGDPKKLKETIQKFGGNFFLTRTNEDPLTRDIVVSDDPNYNYTSNVIKNITKFIYANSENSIVKQEVNEKGLFQKLANANAVSDNYQDAKTWKTNAKRAIIADMYNSGKNDKEIVKDFGTPYFDDNGGFIGYNMSRYEEELENSFDAADNFNYSYKPLTNYEIQVNKYETSLGKTLVDNPNVPGGKEWIKTGKPTDVFAPNMLHATMEDLMTGNFSPYASGNQELTNRIYQVDPANLKDIFAQQVGNPYQKKSQEEKDRSGYMVNKNPKGSAVAGKSYGNDVGSRAAAAGVTSQYYYAQYSPGEVSNIFAKKFGDAARAIYSNSNDKGILTEAIPGFASASGNTFDPKYGIGAKGLKADVNLAKADSPGAVAFGTWVQDWENIKGKVNGNNRRMTFNGLGSSGWEKGAGEDGDMGEVNTKGIALMNKFMDWTKENDTKANSFSMIAQKYANDSKDNSGMKFMLPDKFLKSELIDATKNPNGSLSKEDYDLLTLNGLGVIGQQGDFNNLLIKSQMSAFQAHVDYRQGYTWKHPSNLGEYNIRLGGTGEPDYITTIKLFDYDGKLVGEAENNVTGFGSNIDNSRDDGIDAINFYVNEQLAKTVQQSKNIQNK
jgi:hypothetical protein